MTGVRILARLLVWVFVGGSVPMSSSTAAQLQLELVREIQGVCTPFHAVMMDGYVYCVEYTRCLIKKIHPDGSFEWLGALDENTIATTWQNQRRKPAGCSRQLERPHTIKRYGKTLEISLLGSNDILTVDENGIVSRRHYDKIKGAGLVSVAYAPENWVIAIDYRNEVIQRRRGSDIEYLGCSRFGFGQGWRRSVRFSESRKDCGFIRPHEVLIRGNYLYVADTGNHRVKRYHLNGRFAGWIGKMDNGQIASRWQGSGKAQLSLEPGGFSEPVSMAFDERGDLYVLDYGSGRVQMLDESGLLVAHFDFTSRLKHPYGISIEGDKLVLANTGKNEILIFKIVK